VGEFLDVGKGKKPTGGKGKPEGLQPGERPAPGNEKDKKSSAAKQEG